MTLSPINQYINGQVINVVTGSNPGSGKRKPSRHPSAFVVFVVLLGILLLAIAILASGLVLLSWSHHQTELDRQAAEATQQEHNRLIRTDPIVGLWQSDNAERVGAGGPDDRYNLTIYNDHTFVLYDRVVHTFINGTWEKTGNYYTTDIYTVWEEGRTFPPISISIGHNMAHLSYTYTYKDSPPNSIITSIEYKLIDYYTS
jgi:hypothetical protein